MVQSHGIRHRQIQSEMFLGHRDQAAWAVTPHAIIAYMRLDVSQEHLDSNLRQLTLEMPISGSCDLQKDLPLIIQEERR